VSVEVNDIILAGQGIKVILSGRLIANNSLQFNRPEGGRIELSSGNLVALDGAVIYPGNALSYAITSGGGALIASATVNGTVFPVGTESTYAPVTISGINSGADQISVSVRPAGNPQSFNPWLPDQVNSHVLLKWLIESDVTQTVSLRFDYTGSAEPANWNEVQNRLVAASINSGDFNPVANSLIGESYASADAVPDGLFAIYSDFPNAIPNAFVIEAASAYPNPFQNVVNVQVPQAQPEVFTVQINDLSGRLVFSEQLTSYNGVLVMNDLNNLNNGVYLLNASSENYSFTSRLIKSN
jgi:hypothetical protein